MRTDLKKFSKLNLRPYYPLMILWGMNVVLAVVILIGVVQIANTVQNYIVIKETTQELQNKVDLVTENRKIDQEELDRMNMALAQLIPDDEDYFLVISAVDRLTRQTGFSLTKYSINLSSSTSEKLALSIDGSGDEESFLKLLETYQYEGGRLITNERLEFSPNNLKSVELTLNFYHKKPTQVVDSGNKKITKQDMEFVQSLINKMNKGTSN